MRQVELVIQIPDKVYKAICDKNALGCGIDDIKNIIRNGIIIPKGHSDLIERDKIEYLQAIHDAKFGHISWSDATKKIKYSAPTVIAADKTESANKK